MNLIWNKIEPDNTKDLLFKVQNRSLIPNSEVYYIIKDEEPLDESDAHVLVSKQVGRVTLTKGNTLWYASISGGIFVSSKTEIFKLQNYNITPIQTSVTVTTESIPISVPEGATITFQNLSDSNAGFRIVAGSVGNFILSEKQLFSESFAKDGTVIFMPSSNFKPSEIVYSITPSAVITQLSESMKAKLNELSASVDLLRQTTVSHDELTSFVASTHHNKWSKPAFRQGTSLDKLVSPPFTGNTGVYFSHAITVLDSFSLLMDINVSFMKDGVTKDERGVLTLDGSYRDTGTHNALKSSCTNVEVAKLIESVTITVSENRNEIVVIVNLNQVVLSSGLTTMIKFENGVYDVKQTDPLESHYISTFKTDLVNTGLNLSKDTFNDEMLGTISSKTELGTQLTMNVQSLTNGHSVVDDVTTNDTILDADNFSLVLREADSKYYLVYSFLNTAHVYNMSEPRTILFNQLDTTENLFINLKYIKGVSVPVVDGDVTTVVTELLTMFRKHDYIKTIADTLRNNIPVSITMQTVLEV